MKQTSLIFSLLALSLTLLPGCGKDKSEPAPKANLDDLVYLINEKLHLGGTYHICLYGIPTTDTAKYTLKTTNDQVSFEHYDLVVKSRNARFDLYKYGLMRIIYFSRKDPKEPLRVNQVEIYFDPNKK